MGRQRDRICFHRNCSKPLKLLLSVLGSEFGLAWLGARPGWTPDVVRLDSGLFSLLGSRAQRFYLSWARNSAWLGSELVPVGLRMLFGLTQGSFRFSARGLNTRTRLDMTRGSARFAQDLDQLEARLGSLFGVQVTAARESGSTWGSLGAGRTSSMLGSAELGTQFGAKLGIG